jgi:diguanylate cyclase (GGDEF)-like protein/PAS domain S-box-containing protein
MSSGNTETTDRSPYRFRDLVDVPAFARMLESFFKATGIPRRVVDASGELLSLSAGVDACTEFHRVQPQTAERCRQSNLAIMHDLRDGHVAGGLCKNGLMDYATPVVIEGRQLATLFLGHVLHEPPDLEFFRAQAAQFGFDEKAYLESIKAIPVVDQARMKELMGVMVEMAKMLAASGLARLRQAALERDISTHVERRSQIEDILDFCPVAIGWSEGETRIEYINHQFTQLFGYTLDDLPDLETWYRLAYPDERYRESVLAPWRKAVALAHQNNTQPPELEADITCKDGTVRRVVVRASWVDRRRMVSFTDITELKRAEQSLKQALEFSEGIINAIPDLLFELDLSGKYLNVWSQNPARQAAQKEALLGITVRDALLPDAAKIVMSAIEEADRNGSSFGKVIRIPLPRGESWFELSVSRKPGPSQSDRHFIVLSHDVTERKRLELQLAAHERELRTLVENIPDSIARYTPDARHVYMGPALERTTDKLKEFCLGKTPMECFPDGRYAEYERRIRAVAASGSSDKMEMPVPMPDGTTQFHSIRFFAEHDEKGAVVSVLTIGTDITQRKRMELALAASEREFRTLAQNLSDIMVRYDRDARFVYANPKFEATLGIRLEEVRGKTPTQVPDLLEAEFFEQKVRDVAESGTALEVEHEVLTAKGVSIWGLVRFTPEFDDAGQVKYVQVMTRDITRRWMSEQRMQAHDVMLEMLARGAELSAILNALVRQLEFEDKTARCSVLLLDAEGKHLLTGAAPNLPVFYTQAIHGIEIGMGVGSCGTAAAIGERVVVEDILTHEYWKPYLQLAQEAELRACWSEPLLSSRGKVLGTFAIYHSEPKRPQAEDLERIAFAANLAAIAIENRDAYEELERRAYTDYLTGLTNRRRFLEQAESELARTLRYGGELSILMLDIDRFKQVNDTYGHKVGDLVLQKLSETCLATLRDIDIVGRLGGEEFAILLPETGDKPAMEAAERLRAALAAAQVVLSGGLPLHFTVSIGVATLKDKEANIDTLLNQADQALYRAKSAGRNRVHQYRVDNEDR